jgi:phosphosulfolactate synthase (CoM biosynthesis protein A)
MTGKGSHEARKKTMKAHLTSTEEGVFRDVVNSMVEGLCDKVDAWKTQAAEKVFKYFVEVDQTFHASYLDEDQEESEEKHAAKHNLRKVVSVARKAVDVMALEIKKCEG